jgi:hypothetical protein
MSRSVKIIIIAVVVVLIIAYVMIQNGKQVVMSSSTSCVNNDSSQKWSGDDVSPTDGWGAYKRAKENYIGITNHDSPEAGYVEGFFKAIDAKPSAKGVRTYANEIKAWLNSGRADFHWIIQKGELLC